MAEGDVVLADVDVRVGVGAADLVDQQRVALDRAGGPVGAVVHLEQAAVRRASATTGDRLAQDGARRVRRAVHHLGAGVLVLALAGEGDGQRLATGVLAHEVDGRVLHRDLGADVAVDPLHRGALFTGGAFGDEVVDVVRPVLDGRVPHAGVLLDDDLHDRGVQRVAGVDRRGAALDVVNVGALVGDDQRPLELAHVLGVDAEVGLQRDVDVDARGHVDEGAAGPHRRVERGELVVADRDDGREVLLEDLRVLPERGVGVEEEHALLLQVLTDRVVDDLGLVLRGDAGDEALLLRLGDAELVVGVLDVLGQVFPAGGLLLAGPHEVLDVLEVDRVEVGAPGRHRLAAEEAQTLEAQVEHPLRLVLERGDVADDVLVQPADRGRAGVVGVGPAERVASDVLEAGIRLFDGVGDGRLGRGRHEGNLSAADLVMSGAAGAWCRCRRRWRWWPDAGHGYRGGARTSRSRPRTGAGTRRPRGRPGSGAGRSARRKRCSRPTRRSRRR